MGTNGELKGSDAAARARELAGLSSARRSGESVGKAVEKLEALAAEYPDVEEVIVSLAQGMVNLGCVQEEPEAKKKIGRAHV